MLGQKELIEFLTIPAYLCDESAFLSGYNEAAAELWGWRPATGEKGARFSGMFGLSTVGGESLDRGRPWIESTLATGIPYYSEPVQVLRPDGSLIAVRMQINPIFSGAATILGVMVLLHPHEASYRGRALNDAADEGEVEISPDWIILRINEACSRVWGGTPEESVGRHLWNEFPEAKRNLRYNEYIRAMKEQIKLRFEDYSARHRAWYEVDVRPSEKKGLIVTFRNITDRRYQEERMKMAVEAAEVGSWDWELETNKMGWPPETYRLFDLEPAAGELSFDTFLSCVHPADRQGLLAKIKSGFASRESFQMEFRIVSKEAGTRWMQFRAKGVYSTDGKPFRALGTVMDVTRQKRMELELRRSQERLQLSLSAARMAFFERHLQTNQTSVAGRWYELFGLSKPDPDWSFQRMLSFIHRDDIDIYFAELQSVMELRKTSYSVVYRVVWPDGSIHSIAENAQVSRDELGERILNGVVIDITHLKQAENELTKAVKARDEFLNLASHELRTPIATLSIQIQSLMRQLKLKGLQPESADDWRNALDSCNRQVGTLALLVNNLLDVSRLLHGRFRLDREETSLNDIVKNALKALEYSTATQPVLIDGTFPQSIRGRWDVKRMERVIRSLVTHAIGRSNGSPVVLKSQIEPEFVWMEIKDQGYTMTRSDREELFKPPYRSGALQDMSESGLGLYLAREIVEAHGGEIGYKDQDLSEAGATLWVKLPFLKKEEDIQTLQAAAELDDAVEKTEDEMNQEVLAKEVVV